VADRLRARELLGALVEHNVEFVLIGGLAAVLHGSPAMTNDADICPERTPENLERLAAALRSMHARIRNESEPDGLAFTCDPVFLSRIGTTLNLVTDFGHFDLALRPAAFTGGYSDLLPHAVEYDIDGMRVKVASLGDIIASKEAANRPKDRATLPVLKALQDEIAEQERRADSEGG
jgi:hypothetical protein